MTRFFGKIGYTTPVRSNGVVRDVITERELYGEELRNTRTFVQGESVLGKITVQTRLSVIADAFALENYRDIRYVWWAGVATAVEQVTVERPRLILVLGDRYTGEVVEDSDD
jgi:hypothetical protein